MEDDMNAEDRFYYAQRAEQERARAGVCEDNAAALIHLKLADAYARRVEEASQTVVSIGIRAAG
jgi:hypothetical protein